MDTTYTGIFDMIELSEIVKLNKKYEYQMSPYQSQHPHNNRCNLFVGYECYQTPRNDETKS